MKNVNLISVYDSKLSSSLGRKRLDDVIKNANLEPHQCHSNTIHFIWALDDTKGGFECYWCEGWIDVCKGMPELGHCVVKVDDEYIDLNLQKGKTRPMEIVNEIQPQAYVKFCAKNRSWSFIDCQSVRYCNETQGWGMFQR